MRVRLSERLASVGANVRRLRLKKGLTQEQLAEETGLAPVTVQLVERGRANMTLAVLFALADALGVNAAHLLRPAKPAERPAGRPRKRGSRQR